MTIAATEIGWSYVENSYIQLRQAYHWIRIGEIIREHLTCQNEIKKLLSEKGNFLSFVL